MAGSSRIGFLIFVVYLAKPFKSGTKILQIAYR